MAKLTLSLSIFTYHIVKVPFISVISVALSPLRPKNIPGLIHAESMTLMTLGAPIFSPARMLFRQVAVFAQWENEQAIDDFMTTHRFGQKLAKGWYTRLQFVRQWGHISEFDISKEEQVDLQEGAVVAVTLARMKLPQVPRFIRWGRPVEKLVRDHKGTTLSFASIRLPRTVSTFSVWKSAKEMTDMVHGHSSMSRPKRHSDAMKERNRKDFHFEFTTLRFKPISEHGEWKGQKGFIPNLNKQ